MQPEKMIFLSENHKSTAFWPKMHILNRYAYKSRNMEMNNSEVIKNCRNS